jgi:serine/threonine protein kinase
MALVAGDGSIGGDGLGDAVTQRGEVQPLPPDPLAVGNRIRQYELIRELGRGGMGRVFLARDLKLGRRVAIKFLVGRSAEFTGRFLEEARATARCNHENIVVIHEADEHEGIPYMVLEYLAGTTLRKALDGRRMQTNRAVEIMVPVVRALEKAHAFNLVHRDLKPENIFVTEEGTIKVLDFGLARLFGPIDMYSSLAGTLPKLDTQSSISGTLPYMAPEQFSKEGIDARTDLWAIGMMLWEMVGGRHPLAPYSAQSLFDSAAALDTPMPRIGLEVSDLPDALERIIDCCLEKRRDRRFGSASELLDVLAPLGRRRFGRRQNEDESPYPGLASFQESDADRFFGRGLDVQRTVSQLQANPIAGIVGPSGVGKSSFVRAGLVPALKGSGDPWEILILRPGRSPIASLASLLQPLTSSSGNLQDKLTEHQELMGQLLREPGWLGALLRSRARQKSEQILLFVDQFEELYTLAASPEERLSFKSCLAGVADDAAAPLRVVVSMRSDFLDRVAEHRRFMDDLGRSLVFLQPLGRDSLREALVQPLEARGYRFEDEPMVADMIDSLADAAGGLPLLQFTAAKLWEARDKRKKVLTRESYKQLGGIAGALSTHADAVMASLPAASQKLTRALLLRLVTPEGTRAIVDVSELEELAPGEGRALIDKLVAARLLVIQSRGDAEGATAELVHESLIAGWPSLRRWLDEGKEDAAFVEQLRTAARQWEQRGRAPGLLWRGEAVEEARLWRARTQSRLGSREQEFLEAVLALAGRAARIRGLAAAAAIAFLALVVVVVGALAVSARRAERTAAGEATRAHAAEKQAKDQLEATRSAREAEQQAEAAVARGKQDLRSADAQLEIALRKAEEESRRAREAAGKSQQLADSLQKSNAALEKLLAEERMRADKLAKERKKIFNDLK